MLPRGTARVCSRLLVAAIVGGFAVSAMTACETAAERRYRLIKANLTPELDTLHERDVDIDNAIAITFDENGRMFNEDLGRFFLLNRPSRLTPEPVPRP